jgi:hypothetical protein
MLRAVAKPANEILVGDLATLLDNFVVKDAVYQKVNLAIDKVWERRLHPSISLIRFKQGDMEDWVDSPTRGELKLISSPTYLLKHRERSNPAREELCSGGGVLGISEFEIGGVQEDL